MIENFPKNPSEEQEEQQQQLKHAYSLLRRAYMPPPETAKAARGC